MSLATRCVGLTAPASLSPQRPWPGPTRRGPVIGLSPTPATLFDQGTITGVTGANTGQTRTVSSVTAGTAYLLKPWLFPVTVGDTFRLLPGCDHTTNTCNTVFNNLVHYGGFPYI